MMCKRRIPTYSQLHDELSHDQKLREICRLRDTPSRKLLSRGIDLFGTRT